MLCEICQQPIDGSPQRKTCSEDCRKEKKRRYDIAVRQRQNLVMRTITERPVAVTHKICQTCRRDKPASAFHRTKRVKDGLQNRCKECRRKHVQKPDIAEQESARKAAWYEANKGRLNAESMTRYWANREAVAAKSQARYLRNRERYNAQSRANYLRNKTARIEQAQRYKEHQQQMVRRVCTCGSGFWVEKGSHKWFCSILCRVNCRWRVCREMIHAAYNIGVRLVA